MLAAKPRARRKGPIGSPLPRLAPPTPVKADVEGFRKLGADLGLNLFPWQQTASRYITATNAKGHPLFREVAIVVGRQNGKTRLLLPLVVSRLLKGHRVTHAAQRLSVVGEFHEELAGIFETHYPELLPAKRGVSWRAGQEKIRLKNNAVYQIVAGSGGAPRGPSNQLVVIDELREFVDNRFLAGIKPTTIAQPDGQLVYVSNAGHSGSEVLNGLRARAGVDPNLAYLEWSSPPELALDDVAGWVQANPAIGHNEGLLANLEAEYLAAQLAGTMADFETEYLCRWVVAMEQRLVTEEAWTGQEFAPVGSPLRAAMAINMDISGDRASAVVAWQDRDERINLDVHDTQGAPIDVSLLGPDLVKLAMANRVMETAFDPYTDADLARYLRKARAINGREYANATEKFVRLVAEKKLRIHDPKGVLAEDLRWTTRRSGSYSSYMAVRASDEHSNTAALAAVRATWLASTPTPTNAARIY